MGVAIWRCVWQHGGGCAWYVYVSICSTHTHTRTHTHTQALLYFTEMTPNLNVQDADGWTPLMYAAKSESVVVTKYLLQRGADPNVRQVGGAYGMVGVV